MYTKLREINGVVYKTTNILDGKSYVGIHVRGKKDYLGSGTYLNRAIARHGRENFVRVDIDEFDSIEVGLAKERFWIGFLNTIVPGGYNLNGGGGGQFNPSRETRELLSIAGTGRRHSEETKAKMRLATGRTNKGKPSPKKGKKLSDGTRLKMSLAHKGQKPAYELTDEIRAKMSESAKLRTDRTAGWHHTEETKAKMRKPHCRNKKDGVK